MYDRYLKIGEYEIQCKLPDSYALRWEIVAAAKTNIVRAIGAALGICIPLDKWPFKQKKPLYEYDVNVYGGRIIDVLVANKVNMTEILEVGRVAFELLVNSLISETEVKAAESFFAPELAD